MFWTHQEVRKILRLMRKPHALERERVAVLLREATSARDARVAVQQAIERAFDPSNPADRLRLEIVRRCDVGGETTRAAAAALHLSIRQFFRHRSDAIAAIAQSMERMLRRPPDSQSHLLLLAQAVEAIDPRAALDIYRRVRNGRDGQVAYNIVRTSVWAGIDVTQRQIDACEGPWRLLALVAVARHLVSRGENERAAVMREELRAELAVGKGPRYDAAGFELAFLDRCEAYRKADTAQGSTLLGRMRSLAGENEALQALTMLCEADQALVEGDLTAAAVALDDVEVLEIHNRDLNVMARTALGKAMLSHVRGYHEEAFALANGGALAIAALEGAVALRAASIAGRAALLCGASWEPPRALFEKYPDVWTHALAQAVAARHLLATDPRASQTAAASALALAQRHDAPVAACYAQVSLAGALDVQGKTHAAQELRVAAWQTALRCGDEFALFDLFHNPAAPSHDIGCMMLDERFFQALQTHLGEKLPAAISDCLRAVAGEPTPPQSAPCIREPLDLVGRAAVRAAAFCVPPQQRRQFEERFAQAWNEAPVKAQHLAKANLARAI